VPQSETATNSEACASYLMMVPEQLLATDVPASMGRGFRLPSERFNTRATHIQCCPRQPRESSAGHQRFPANRVRSATASGAVG